MLVKKDNIYRDVQKINLAEYLSKGYVRCAPEPPAEPKPPVEMENDSATDNKQPNRHSKKTPEPLPTGAEEA